MDKAVARDNGFLCVIDPVLNISLWVALLRSRNGSDLRVEFYRRGRSKSLWVGRVG